MSKSVPMLCSASVKGVEGAEETVQDDLWDNLGWKCCNRCSTAGIAGSIEDEGLQRATVLAAC